MPPFVRRSARSSTTRRNAPTGCFIAAFETLALGDLSLLIRFGVQFGLFGGSIYFLGTDAQRRRYLPDAASVKTPGCFAMSQRALLDRLGALHGIEAIRADAGFFFAEGWLERDKGRALREQSELLVGELRESAVGLVDAFGIPAACLAAPIAFMDPAHPTW